MTSNKVYPFLRWAGGKRWLASHLSPILRSILDKSHGVYFEPFLGAASMYFGLAPQKSVLTDLNQELIETYIAVRDFWEDVEQIMKEWNVSKEKYYEIRSYIPEDPIRKAARFIWLNRTCYGGLYRVNKKNQFNVPYGGGRTPDILYEDNVLEKCSDTLKGIPFQNRSVILKSADFEEIMNNSNEGDVIYCDPTYSCVTKNHFDRYGPIVFDWESQKRLAKTAKIAFNRGVVVVVSNAYSKDLLELFDYNFKIILSKKKTIGNCAAKSETHKEYLLILDPDQNRHSIWKELNKSLKGKAPVKKVKYKDSNRSHIKKDSKKSLVVNIMNCVA